MIYFFVLVVKVEAYANQDSNRPMPSHGLPSKILCRVVNVQLKVSFFSSMFLIHKMHDSTVYDEQSIVLQAERDTDEVFAQVSLVPEHEVRFCSLIFG